MRRNRDSSFIENLPFSTVSYFSGIWWQQLIKLPSGEVRGNTRCPEALSMRTVRSNSEAMIKETGEPGNPEKMNILLIFSV
jgi:hypothetical protein